MTLPNGIYRIKTNTGEFAATMAIQIHEGKGRPVRISTAGNWGMAREEFTEMTAKQLDMLAEYGLHDNQSVAHHTVPGYRLPR